MQVPASLGKQHKCFINLLKACKYAIVQYVGFPAGTLQGWRSGVFTANHL